MPQQGAPSVASRTRASSYDVCSIGAGIDAETARLSAQVDLFWEKERRLYESYGLAAARRVVELGCGPGFVLRHMAHEFPDLELHGLELDPDLVARARDMFAEESLDVTVREASILDTGYEEGAFDFVLVRLVLEHLPDPERALHEVFRITKPGGRAVVADNDFEMHLMASPPVPELREVYSAYCRAREDEGGNPLIGRDLPLLLRETGFVDVDYDIVAAHSAVLGDEIFSRSEGISIPSRLVQDGYLSSSTMGHLSRRWRDVVRSPRHAQIRQLHVSAGRRPTI